MTLNVRLTMWITMIFIVALLVDGVMGMQRARLAIAAETQSTAHLTARLLELALTSRLSNTTGTLLQDLQAGLDGLMATRHLRITLLQEGRPWRAATTPRAGALRLPPAWFVHLVSPAGNPYRTVLNVPGFANTQIEIVSDPAAEIAEAWDDYRTSLMVLLTFFAIANALAFVVIRGALAPVQSILAALNTIKQGDYGIRLPGFRLPEFRAIAERFNDMASVLRKSREENRALAQHSLAIQEQERRHLARELHDDMGQSVSAIKALAVAITERSSDTQIAFSARTIADVATEIYNVVKGMMRTLRPAALDELGLSNALQEMIDDWNSRYAPVQCTLDYGAGDAVLSEDISIGLFRLVQECLTNVAKHARATHVTVRLKSSATGNGRGQCVHLTVVDDGVGMPPTSEQGFGILGMRERVAALLGRFSISSPPAGGVIIEVTIPLDQPDAAADP